jgi:excisionase family DNA binding protein
MERRSDASIEELLHHERYTPEEVSRLLGIGLDVIRHAAFTGELRAQMAGHDIISLRREDVLAWLDEREGNGQVDIADARG